MPAGGEADVFTDGCSPTRTWCRLLQPNFDDTAALDIRRGCAQSLELALLADTAAGHPEEASQAASGAGMATNWVCRDDPVASNHGGEKLTASAICVVKVSKSGTQRMGQRTIIAAVSEQAQGLAECPTVAAPALMPLFICAFFTRRFSLLQEQSTQQQQIMPAVRNTSKKHQISVDNVF